MNPETPAHPFFEVGQRYEDRKGEYTVRAIDGDKLVLQYADDSVTTENARLKERIHRSIVAERSNSVGRQVGRATGKRQRLAIEILSFEADADTRTGAEIDVHLRACAAELGYSSGEAEEKKLRIGRSTLENDGDWAKGTLTEDRLHETVGQATYRDAQGASKTCNVYRITAAGLDFLAQHRRRH
jgi:hypothetical protein